MARQIITTGLGFSVLAGLLSCAAIILFLSVFTTSDHRPSIIADLPNRTLEIAPAWEQRLMSRYPPGTQESELVRDLTDWGFQVDPVTSTNLAVFETTPIICAETFTVEWTTTRDQQIASITSGFHASCL